MDPYQILIQLRVLYDTSREVAVNTSNWHV